MAGARKVYAVEASGVADFATKLVKANSLDGVVKVNYVCIIYIYT